MHLPPDWGVFATLVVSFLVFWFIFGAIFFGPFLRLISARERHLNDLNSKTEQLLREQREAVTLRASELAEVRRGALSQRESERRAAQEQAGKVIEQARAEAGEELDKVRGEIEAEFAAAGKQLEELARNLATELASKVLARPVASREPSRLNS